jgi:C-terminal processing protease CtpA/Prc
VISVRERDPDFNVIDGSTHIYSPLSDQALRLSGQKGLQVGDVIVGVNGESVMRVPDIHMLLRGMAGRSVRLDVLRLASDESTAERDGEADENTVLTTEPVITVPLEPYDAQDLLYHAWEWKTQKLAKELADKAGFTVGYVHLQDQRPKMRSPEDSFPTTTRRLLF